MASTIRDVAREARVSVASVSRALNGQANVSDRTRRRVVQAATRLRYVPHSGARSLITRRTQLIGVVLPDLYGEFFSEIMRGIDQAARQAGFDLLVSAMHGHPAEATQAIRAMRGRVDGLLFMFPHTDAAIVGENMPESMPAVAMNTPACEQRYPSLRVDNYGGAYSVIRHLVGLGRRNIAFVTGPEDNCDAQERLRGYQAARGCLGCGPELLVAGDFSEESGFRAGQELIAQRLKPDAIFAANDMMAVGCLRALTEAGIGVGHDIGLVGFDDIPIARYTTPPLTTVRVGIAELGQRALHRVLRAIDGDEVVAIDSETIGTELVVRSSCGGNRPPGKSARAADANTDLTGTRQL